MNLQSLSIERLDLMFSALPRSSEAKDLVAAEIEKRVTAGEVNTSKSDKKRSMMSQKSQTLTKAFETLQLS